MNDNLPIIMAEWRSGAVSENTKEYHGQKRYCLWKMQPYNNRQSFTRSRGGPACDKIAMDLRAASQILNKTKDFFESLKYNLIM